MSLLSLAKRAEVIAHLCEGAGIRPTSRLASVSQPTILSLLLKVGTGCDRLHDRLVRDLSIRDIQMDEIWSYVQKKQARVKPEDDPTWGDAYTWLAIARSQKIIVSYRVGKRDDANAQAFVRDLRARLVTMPMICSDGFASYASAVGAHFEAVDFAQVVKNYSRSPKRVRDGQPSAHRPTLRAVHIGARSADRAQHLTHSRCRRCAHVSPPPQRHGSLANRCNAVACVRPGNAQQPLPEGSEQCTSRIAHLVAAYPYCPGRATRRSRFYAPTNLRARPNDPACAEPSPAAPLSPAAATPRASPAPLRRARRLDR